jgi:hypothetical protein
MRSVAAAIGLVTLTLSATASAGPGGGCVPAGSKILRAHDGGRVYSHGDDTYACSKSYARSVRLSDPEAFVDALPPYSVNRRWVVFFSRYCEGDGCFNDLEERSLRTGKTRFVVANGPTALDCTDNGDCGAGAVTALRLKANGSAVWIGCPGDDGECDDVPHYVVRRDSRGKRIIERGQIAPHSLRLLPSGRRVSWLKDGRRRSATLR